MSCNCSKFYWSPENDNFYCITCKKGAGEQYYLENKPKITALDILQRFVDSYPCGINPDLDSVYRDALSFLKKS